MLHIPALLLWLNDTEYKNNMVGIPTCYLNVLTP